MSPSPREAPPSGARRGLPPARDNRLDRALTWAAIAVYAALVLAGATTSSLGIDHLRVDPALPHADRWGPVQPIRSDEYFAFTPIRLSTMATGGSATISLMSEGAEVVHRYTSGEVLLTLAYPDAAAAAWLAGVLPDAMVFAAHWWLPSLLTVVCMPRWFARLGAHRNLGWLVGFLVVVNPANVWWSFQPVQHVGLTLAGCTVLLAAQDRWHGVRHGRRRRWPALAQAACGGLLLAGLPSGYLPWAIVLGLPIVLATVARILFGPARGWDRWRVLIVGAEVALVVGLGALWQARAGLASMLGTVYPGQRVSTAVAQPFGFVFGSPFLGVLASEQPRTTNASEIATAPTVAVVALVAAWVLAWPRGGFGWRDRAPDAVLAVTVLGWLGWCTIDLGPLGAALPLLNRVEPARAAQVVGVLALIAAGLALSRLPADSRRRRGLVATIAGVAAAVVSLAAGVALRTVEFPALGWPAIVAVTVAVGAVVGLLVWRPRSVAVAALSGVLAVAGVAGAGPVQFGLGDLRGSATADLLLGDAAAARAAHRVWVSDSSLSFLLTATGTPTLGGLMRAGPDRDRWAALDPLGAAEDAWNRGGGYVTFTFAPGEPTQIASNGYDQVFVRVDPCTLAAAMPDLARLATATPLDAPCLRAAGTVAWAGDTVRVYDVVR